MPHRQAAGPVAIPESLTAVTRHRTVVATIADAIVAAAVGRSLRVVVGWSDPGETAFADRLTRALVARGLACQCLLSSSRFDGADSRTAGPLGNSSMAVISSGAAGLDESDLCRVDIQLSTRSVGHGSPALGQEPHRQARYAVEGGRRPDIIVNYLDPDGPAIRHIVPILKPAVSTRMREAQRDP
jgi:hypothetical protein